MPFPILVSEFTSILELTTAWHSMLSLHMHVAIRWVGAGGLFALLLPVICRFHVGHKVKFVLLVSSAEQVV